MNLKFFSGIILLALFFSIYEKTNAQNVIWGKDIGGTGNEYSYAIAVDPETGYVYTTGSFYGTVDFDPGEGTFNLTSGGYDIFISKLDSSGNFVWAKAINGLGYYEDASVGYAIAIDSAGGDGVYITGWFSGHVDFDPGPETYQLIALGSSDIFISKLDTSGNFVWAKSIGALYYNASGRSIALDTFGNVYTTGSFRGTADFDPGPDTFYLSSEGDTRDIFISKLDYTGNFVWAKSIGGSSVWNNDGGQSISLDASANVYTTGIFSGPADFDPGAGTFILMGDGIFISKLNSAGNFIWAKSMEGEGIGTSIDIDPGSGDVYTAGFFPDTTDFDPGPGTFNLIAAGNSDIFISKLDSSGNFIWAKAIGGIGDDRVFALTVDPTGSGDVYTTGSFEGTVDFDPGAGTYLLTSAGCWDIFISKLDSAGDFAWAIGTGGEYCEDVGTSIALNLSGNVLATGYFDSPVISFGCPGISNHETICSSEEGGYEYICYLKDIYIVKLDQNPPGFLNVVTNNNDSGSGSLRDIVHCSLSGSTIIFDSSLIDQTITLTSGEIYINKDLIISGPGMLDLTISGNHDSRIFYLYPENNLEVENLALKNAGGYYGGAIYVNGYLILENVLFQNNFENGIPKAMTISPGTFVTIAGNVEIKY